MDRGIKDESFIRRALEIATSEDGRWVANQSAFNGASEQKILPSVLAALVTATNIYVQKNKLDELKIKEALKITTVGEARSFIDRNSDAVSLTNETD